MRIGNALLVAGLLLVVVGSIVRFAPWLIAWFGRLPGDIRFDGRSSRVYIPISSMLVVSVVITWWSP